MSIMQLQITAKQYFVEIDGGHGREFVMADYPYPYSNPDVRAIRRDISNANNNQDFTFFASWYSGGALTIYSVKLVLGYGVRLSAPGYMDCTDWTVYTNKRKARRAARELMRADD